MTRTLIPVWIAIPMLFMMPVAAVPSDVVAEGTLAMGPQVLAERGRVYAIYLPEASTTGELDLSGTTRTYTQQWYNPRTGAFEGDTSRKSGGGWVPLGRPPQDPEDDWVVLVNAAD